MQKQKTRIDFIDFAKGFAMITIVLMHYLEFNFDGLFRKAIIFGGSGVHLFILISGFGLGLSSQSLALSKFFKKRFSKILIPYYIYITFVFLLNIFISIYPNDGFYAYLGHIFLFKMFDENIVVSYGFHLWFISAIIQLYIIFPLLIKLKSSVGTLRFGLITFGISLLYWIVLAIFNFDDLLVISNSGIQFLWEFSLGIILADYYLKKEFKFWEINNSYLQVITFIGISFTGLIALYGGRTGQTLNDIPALFGYTGLVILIYNYLEKIEFIKNSITSLGKVSYELYLIHMLVLFFMNHASDIFPFIWTNSILFKLLATFPAAILISYLFSWINKKVNSALPNF
jgi:peptidoglycan/LPS O-acetylase OafA/YrhL